MQKRHTATGEQIGVVTCEERDLIQALHVRKAGLAELFAAVARMDDELRATALYQRLVQDMGAVALEYQQWWDAMADRYGWQRHPDRNWRIDFEACAVYLE